MSRVTNPDNFIDPESTRSSLSIDSNGSNGSNIFSNQGEYDLSVNNLNRVLSYLSDMDNHTLSDKDTIATTSTATGAPNNNSNTASSRTGFVNPFEINSSLWSAAPQQQQQQPQGPQDLLSPSSQAPDFPRDQLLSPLSPYANLFNPSSGTSLTGPPPPAASDFGSRRASYVGEFTTHSRPSTGSIWNTRDDNRSSLGSAGSPLLNNPSLNSPPQLPSVWQSPPPSEFAALRRYSYDTALGAAHNGLSGGSQPLLPGFQQHKRFPSSSFATTTNMDFGKSFEQNTTAQTQPQQPQVSQGPQVSNALNFQDQYSQAYKEADLYFTSPSAESLNLSKVLESLNTQQLPKFPGGGLPGVKLILVCFKNGRLDVFYLPPENQRLTQTMKIGELVIVEADRGRDLGKVVKLDVSIDEARLLKLKQFQEQQAALNQEVHEKHPVLHFPKPVVRFAYPNEVAQLLLKKSDEEKSRNVCQLKVKSHGLVMQITDSEYQWDRRKLTFYYNSNARIDFRDLVKELFRIYKTRIWMCKQQKREV
ncbi:hypothetical protein OGAPHI_002958 [Ogataea philodendri]|uniref:PSP1 C-terminal domain-containing protein n=1 Tax=Ogataea philodendri TaxID=1378263 RepID=A0A9P8T6E6_9ASCO|nr:uncharacterized protein OGAPHI_002958 [Ogataea philodendri]KAH3667309.1 hypothetical protein OGAPHI_002958 [Ogataea philodendri]